MLVSMMSLFYLLAVVGLVAACQPKRDPALIITGGRNKGINGYNWLRSVEVYHPRTNTLCTLPSLKANSHTQNGLIKCGGQSCHTLNTDTAKWTKTHNLSELRSEHSSWKREDGSIMLIGSEFGRSKITTEVISGKSGVSTPGFTLKYETRAACGITDTSSVVITGGSPVVGGPISRVTRYDKNGWVEDLPSLLTARNSHGCALYTTDTGDKVYVVIGGSGDYRGLSNTETLQLGEDAWRESTAFPRQLYGLQAATLDNIIYITGGFDGYFYRDEIYLLDTKSRSWVEVAKMKTRRGDHGLSVINYSEVEDICTEE